MPTALLESYRTVHKHHLVKYSFPFYYPPVADFNRCIDCGFLDANEKERPYLNALIASYELTDGLVIDGDGVYGD